MSEPEKAELKVRMHDFIYHLRPGDSCPVCSKSLMLATCQRTGNKGLLCLDCEYFIVIRSDGLRLIEIFERETVSEGNL